MDFRPERMQLVSAPTPLHAAPRLAEAIGLDAGRLYIKREDLGTLGGGGNKLRMLEVSIADALAEGADVLVTSGSSQSNHLRLAAAVAGHLGLGCVLVVAEEPGPLSGNLLLAHLTGAEIVWAGKVTPTRLTEIVHESAGTQSARGRQPSIIPFGGTSIRSAEAHAVTGREIFAAIPDLQHVVVAVGSGATMAGLASALPPRTVVGVDCGSVSDVAEVVDGLLDHLTMGAQRQVRILNGYVGSGYSRLNPVVSAAMRLAAQTEGILLDPLYTGRAMAGLVDLVRSGGIAGNETTVFVHTGGLPSVFDYGSELVLG